MRYTILVFFAMLLAMASCEFENAAAPGPGKTDDGENVVEVLMFDEAGKSHIGTALFPHSLMDAYSNIEFYVGETPPPSVDFDIVAVPMKEGGEVYLLCRK